MEFTDKEIKRLAIITLVAILAFLAFLVVRPVLLSVVGGLILAYIFYPVLKLVSKKIKNRTLASSIVLIIVLLLIAVPLWFIIPIMIQQVFQVFRLTQTLDLYTSVQNIFPTASDEFISQTATSLTSFIGKAATGTLNSLASGLLDVPRFLLNVFIIAFIFFFALRDGPKLGRFVSELSPLSKRHELLLVQRFRNITESIVYGQVIVGVVQGIIAGIGFLIFGIPNPLVLTVLAIVLSIIPVVGPVFIWLPISIVLFISGDTSTAIGFTIYNALLTSSIDNILRPYIVARKTSISQAVILVGMIGGLFVFGILGLVLGPLILAYFLTFLEAYKDKTLSEVFK